MTEIPEHLLRRSRERRAALGLGGDDAGGEAPTAAPAPAAPAAAAPDAPAVAAAAAPSVPATPTPEPVSPYLAPPVRRRVPVWMYPVLGLLPVWVALYAGAFGDRTSAGPVDPIVLGEEIYRTSCGGCHGANGQGAGQFPALAEGEAVKTFPEEADHISWVRTGSAPFKGQPYGDPNREGGQRVAETGGMPPFAGVLSEEEIEAVVLYEREGL